MRSRTPFARDGSCGLAVARVAALSALALLLLAPTGGPRVERTRGAVEIGSGEPPVWRAAHEGDALAPGDAVRTGRDGRAELALPAGSVRLYGDSVLRIPLESTAPSGADSVRLDAGTSLFDVLRRAGEAFEVRTPEVVVSIKGTRFLVVADERPEVAVFQGVVGLRRELDAAQEMLVREGFAAFAAPGGPFELVWSGAPDPWEAWLDGSGPPRAADSAGAGASTEALELEAKAAALARSRRDAVEQATRRHPEVAERVAKAIGRGRADGAGVHLDAAPAAPDPDPLADAPDDRGEKMLEERYVEAWLNGLPGGGQGAGFDLTPLEGAVVVNGGGQSWTLSEAELESVLQGVTSLPQPLLDAVVDQGGTAEQLAEQLLGLLR